MNKQRKENYESEDECKIVSLVSPRQVFNLSLFEVYLVIDCRPREQYLSGHVASALNFPPPTNESSLGRTESLLSFATYASENYANERWNPIVIYGDTDDQKVCKHLSWFTNRFMIAYSRRLRTRMPQSAATGFMIAWAQESLRFGCWMVGIAHSCTSTLRYVTRCPHRRVKAQMTSRVRPPCGRCRTTWRSMGRVSLSARKQSNGPQSFWSPCV